jgi:ankyrin repeat protein
MYAAAMSGCVDAIQVLAGLGLGLDVKTGSADGETPMHIAAQNGHVDAIKALAALGAVANSTTSAGTTAIYCAAHRGHVNAIKVLVGLGADIHAPRCDGISPILAAASNGHVSSIKLLFKFGADLAPASCARSALQLSRGGNHLEASELIEQLLSKARRCGGCEGCGRVSVHLKKCSYCKEAWYCSQECSTRDWNLKHKKQCSRQQKQRQVAK